MMALQGKVFQEKQVLQHQLFFLNQLLEPFKVLVKLWTHKGTTCKYKKSPSSP